MSAKIVDDGPGDRVIIRGRNGAPDRVETPLAYADEALPDEEKRLLIRWIEASELSKGNMAVAALDGEARGRFADFVERMSMEDYILFEVEAYRWIQSTAFGRKMMQYSEILARMSGDRVEIDFIKWGELIANSDNRDIAIGAGIGIMRGIAAGLEDAYRDFAYHMRETLAARKAGRELAEGDSGRRIRRGREVRHAFQRRQIGD